jgi:Fur family ferric uptake transcriptional regulator
MKKRRNSKQRDLILEILRSHGDHPSADEIYLEARKENASLSRGTVYRNLNLLAATGEIRQVKIPGADRFDCRLEPHYHLLCTGCGRVVNVPIPYDAGLDCALRARMGYEIIRHRTVFEGVCPQCRAGQDGEEQRQSVML